jgi:pimeloyl-ACP methyl ester carboxylesterase
MTKLTAVYYWAGGALPRPLGNSLLASPLIVRGMSILLAKTKDKELRTWIHREHDENFSNFASRRVAHEGFLASISHNVGEYASKIRQPTLLIIGERDDITSVSDQHAVQGRFANAALEQIDGVGHLIHYEAPLLAARFIQDFVEAAK